MRRFLDSYFGLTRHRTTIRREITAGATTFVTMAYIIVVNPKILEGAGMPFGPVMAATIAAAFIGTLAMGFYARRPFAVAPYMGANAFIAVTVVGALGHTWQQALGAVLIGGVLFVLLTILGIRAWLASSLPEGLKIAFVVGIGFFLAFVGLNSAGLVQLGVPGSPVQMGDFRDPGVLLAVGCLLLTGVLLLKRIPGAVLIGILATAAAGFLCGEAPLPDKILGPPPDPRPVLLALDLRGALTWDFFPIVLTVFVMDFVDTMGTLLGVSYRAGLLDERGELPEVETPLLCDAGATVAGALLGTTTTGTYLESAAGIEAGGRTGLTAVTTGLLFLTALFLAPLFGAVPGFAYGPALVIVGMLMMGSFGRLAADDLTELLPAFITIALMSFTLNLAVGLTAGFVTWPLFKLLAGRRREVPPGLWVLGGLSFLFYVFYPYG